MKFEQTIPPKKNHRRRTGPAIYFCQDLRCFGVFWPASSQLAPPRRGWASFLSKPFTPWFKGCIKKDLCSPLGTHLVKSCGSRGQEKKNQPFIDLRWAANSPQDESQRCSHDSSVDPSHHQMSWSKVSLPAWMGLGA